MLYKVVLTFKTIDVTIQIKATVQCFHVVLFIMLFKSVDEAIVCESESY